MKAEDFLSDDFLKQFKTGDQLNDFLDSIQKRAIEKMLEGELDDHLGYEKHQQSDNPNAREGHVQLVQFCTCTAGSKEKQARWAFVFSFHDPGKPDRCISRKKSVPV